jgi:hypothetical protein
VLQGGPPRNGGIRSCIGTLTGDFSIPVSNWPRDDYSFKQLADTANDTYWPTDGRTRQSLFAFKMCTTIIAPQFDEKKPSIQIRLYMFHRNMKMEGSICFSIYL